MVQRPFAEQALEPLPSFGRRPGKAQVVNDQNPLTRPAKPLGEAHQPILQLGRFLMLLQRVTVAAR